MNKKILAGIGIAIVAVAVGIVSMKSMLGDEATELPFEEQSEKALNLQEPGGSAESSESGESAEQESKENNP